MRKMPQTPLAWLMAMTMNLSWRIQTKMVSIAGHSVA
jgi:hypothetical protein